MIEVNNLFKQFDKYILKDINLTIPEGYIVGVVGRNGAGKTSLFNILLGLYGPSSGSITIDGKGYTANEVEIRDKLGYVLGDDLMDAGLKLAENGRRYGAYYSRYDHDRYLGLLEEFNLDAKKKFGRLSKGQKLKAQFAFALACNPKYLILDEPTANFDLDFKELFMKEIREFVSNGENTVLLATQITEDLETCADYLIYLDKGQLVYAGDIESFRDSYRIVTGDLYKVKLLKMDEVIAIDMGPYSTKALIRINKLRQHDPELQITYPTIEEFMFLYDKAPKRN